MGQIRKIQKTQGGKGQIRRFFKKKQEGKNGGKKKKRFPCTWRFPYSCVLHELGTPLGYRPHVTLPQENRLVWEQQNPRIIDPSITPQNKCCFISM